VELLTYKKRKKCKHLYNPIFAKNIFKDAFFVKFLSLILTV